MRMVNRGPGSPSGRRRAFRPTNEGLEDRRLLATINVGATQTRPYGIEAVGPATNATAGYTVTDVGNVTGSGYDSFVVSAPGLSTTTVGGTPAFGIGSSAAYLVFGSKQVNVGNAANFIGLTNGVASATTPGLTAGQRAADLSQLGTLGATGSVGQLNPTVIQPTTGTQIAGFNYDGLTFVTGSNRASGLGFSVSALGDVNGDGIDDFAITAPNDTGGGRVFVIYGGTNLANQNTASKTIDLEPTAGVTTSTAPTKVVSFSVLGGTTGTQVGYSVAGLGNYFNTTPGRDIGIGVPGLNGNTGAAYAISGAYVNSVATGTNVDLATVGVQGGRIGITYTGIKANDRTGASVSTAGSFDGAASNIANQRLDDFLIGAPGAGAAYLVYSVQTTVANSTLGTVQPLSTLGVAPTTNPITTPLQGVVFSLNGNFGQVVAEAGDFNNDGAGDIMIGAPASAGATPTSNVYLIYGQTGTATGTPARLNGIFIVSPTATSTAYKSTVFVGTSFFGYSLAPSAHVTIGTAPTGTTPVADILIGSPVENAAYLIPGNTTLSNTVVPVSLTTISATPLNGTGFTQTTSPDGITSVGFGTSVSARNPVFITNTSGLTLDSDAVPDLFFGAPFTNLNTPGTLAPSRTLAGVAYAIEGALIGGAGPVPPPPPPPNPGGGAVPAVFTPTAGSLLAPPIFTGDNAGLPFPTASSLSHLTSYRPLPVQIAYNQFLASPGFLAREEAYHHPYRGVSHQAPVGSARNVSAIHYSENRFTRIFTVTHHQLSVTKFKYGRSITFTHPAKVIPRIEQTQTFRA